MNYSFAQPELLIDFMFNAADSIDTYNPNNVFLEWEVTSIFIEISNGLNLSIMTRVIDPTGVKDYITWKKIREVVRAFIDSNSTLGMTLDIRMRLPKDLKLQIDPNNEYRDFNISFFSKADVTMVSITSVERKIENASYVPVEKWTDFISNLINVWKLKTGVV